MDAWLNSMSSLGATPGGQDPTPEGQTGPNGELMPGIPAPAGYKSVDQMNAVQNLLSVPIQQTTAQFNAARNNILASMPPGGARDLALAKLEANRTSTISNLFMGAQNAGVEGLTKIGLGTAGDQGSTLSRILQGADNLYDMGTRDKQSTIDTFTNVGKDLFGILFKDGGLFGKKSTSAAADTKPKQTAQSLLSGATALGA